MRRLQALLVLITLSLSLEALADNRPSGPAPGIASRVPASRLASGADHSCALRPDGSVRCWGNNDTGQLGDGTTTDRRTPVPVTGLANATSVSPGFRHTCAALADGTARCWGNNDRGMLGDGTTTNRATPVVVTGL